MQIDPLRTPSSMPIVIQRADIQVQQNPIAGTWQRSEVIATLALIAAIGIPVTTALIRNAQKRISLERQLVEIPSKNSDAYTILVHHLRGESIRVASMLLRLSVRNPTAAERERFNELNPASGFKMDPPNPSTSEMPFSVNMPIATPDTDGASSPLFHAGDSFSCSSDLHCHWPWELVNAYGDFATLELWSMGRIRARWPASHDLRPCIWHFVNRRKGNGKLIRDVSNEELAGLKRLADDKSVMSSMTPERATVLRKRWNARSS